MDDGVLKIRKTALRNMSGVIHKLRNLIFPLKRYVIYGCPLNHHKQSKLVNCNVIPLYLVSFAVILQLKLCLKYFIRNIHGYPWIYPLSNLLDISIAGFCLRPKLKIVPNYPILRYKNFDGTSTYTFF
jgi:hypothetical protein